MNTPSENHSLASQDLTGQDLATSITKSASRQSFYTISLLADRERLPDAYRAYAYFRWVDDLLDSDTASPVERSVFLQRQQGLLEACYRREAPGPVCVEEQMLVDLVAHDAENNSGLQTYLRNMMAVMAFDVERRGRLISQAELVSYSRLLAIAVTEALHYFIGNACPTPPSEARYLAVQGAHIIHMLRDMLEDTSAGYFNIPREYLEAHRLSLQDAGRPAFRAWVHSRVLMARQYFRRGREYTRRVKNLRCRLAGYAYIARFEWVARLIERDGYRLRASYPERKSLSAGIWMAWRTVASLFGLDRVTLKPCLLAVQPAQTEEL